MHLLRFFNTIRYLKPIQIYGRLWFKLYQPKPDLSPAPSIQLILNNWLQACKKKTSFLSPFKFDFLNVTHEIKSFKDWNNANWGKLWLYNLHYFDDLQSYESINKKKLHAGLIEKWIKENLPGIGNGWEPYPISLRIVNWVKWSLDGNTLSVDALNSLAVQVRFLSKRLEYHLLGNHLFVNAKALIFAGLFFTGNEAEKWLNKGLQILSKQIPEQILDDGGHFELSPMYHSIILEDILDLINIMRAYGHTPLKALSDSATKMLVWLSIMSHPDKMISFFNDSTFGIASELDALRSYAKRLNISRNELPQKDINLLEDSGFIRLNKGNSSLIADIGKIGPDYQPGHAHADTLSFEFSIKNKRIFVNSGISCYGNSENRLFQRGTSSHNTLVIDGENSSEVWDGFRVARRAYPIGLKIKKRKKGLYARCGHNGYRNLNGSPLHWREWNLREKEFEIKDQVVGSYSNIEAFYHLYPGAIVDLQKRKIVFDDICIDFKTDADVVIKETNYYPEFGKSIPNQCLVVKPLNNEYSIKFYY